MIEPARTFDERATLVAYLASKMGTSPEGLVGQMPFEIVAVRRDGKPMGAVMYINYRQTSIEMACAGEPGWLTRGNLRDLFAYPFLQLKVWTALTLVARSNRIARAFNTKLGFVELCTIPSGRKESDTILYGMTRNQCSWIGDVQHASPVANGAYVHG